MTEVTTVYDRFTALARRVLVAARDAAASLGHDFIGSEHLLIGLPQTAGGASEVLRARGVGLDLLRAEVERQLAAGGVAATHGAAVQEALATLGIDGAEIRRLADASFGSGSFQFPRPAFSARPRKPSRRPWNRLASWGKTESTPSTCSSASWPMRTAAARGR